MSLDIYHYFGNDLVVSATGDLLVADDTTTGQQNVLRRLLTNPADSDAGEVSDYLWHPEYGAGVRKIVGSTKDAAAIRAVIRGQILLEAAVSPTPEPVISVDTFLGGVSVTIQYNDARTGEAKVLAFDITQ